LLSEPRRRLSGPRGRGNGQNEKQESAEKAHDVTFANEAREHRSRTQTQNGRMMRASAGKE
jgi:hypothetical protein